MVLEVGETFLHHDLFYKYCHRQFDIHQNNNSCNSYKYTYTALPFYCHAKTVAQKSYTVVYKHTETMPVAKIAKVQYVREAFSTCTLQLVTKLL